MKQSDTILTHPSQHHTPQEELKRDLLRMRREKERAQAAAQQAAQAAAVAAIHNQQQHALAHTHSITSQHHLTTTIASAHKRKREEEKETVTSAKSKKKKMISTTSTRESKKDTKLYCICKTPYDETKYDDAFLNNQINSQILTDFITQGGRHGVIRPCKTLFQFSDEKKVFVPKSQMIWWHLPSAVRY